MGKMLSDSSIIRRNKDIVFVLLAAVAILLAPLVAMQFSEEVDWKLSDFGIIGALLFGIGSVYVFVTRKISGTKRQIVVGSVLFAALMLIWAELAVGVFGTPFAGS